MSIAPPSKRLPPDSQSNETETAPTGRPPTSSDNTSGDDNHRRSFLVKFFAVVVGSIAGLIPLLAGVCAYLDPLRRTAKQTVMIRLGTLHDLGLDPPDLEAVFENRDVLVTQKAVVADREDAWNVYPNEPIGRVIVCRRADENGKPSITVFNAACPHAGCVVSYKEDETDKSNSRYRCPCHNSTFATDGEMVQPTPSPRSLDSLNFELRLRDDGRSTAEHQKKKYEVWVQYENFYTGKTEKVAKA